MSEAANKIDERLKARVPVKAGPHMVGVTFVRRNSAESDEPLQPHERRIRQACRQRIDVGVVETAALADVVQMPSVGVAACAGRGF